jgi:peptide deformylase
MPVREIVRYPDPRLKAKAAPVRAFDGALSSLIADLIDTMRAAPGVGITAPHIGVAFRIVVLELPGETTARVYVNPEVTRLGQARIEGPEGSISMPGATEEIERAGEVTVAFQRVDGTRAEETATGFHAVCLQHEIDQLDGIFWIERLSRLKRERLIKRWRKAEH